MGPRPASDESHLHSAHPGRIDPDAASLPSERLSGRPDRGAPARPGRADLEPAGAGPAGCVGVHDRGLRAGLPDLSPHAGVHGGGDRAGGQSPDLGHPADHAPERPSDRVGKSFRTPVLHPGPAGLLASAVPLHPDLRWRARRVDRAELRGRRLQRPGGGGGRGHPQRHAVRGATRGLRVLRLGGDLSLPHLADRQPTPHPGVRRESRDVDHDHDAAQSVPRPREPPAQQQLRPTDGGSGHGVAAALVAGATGGVLRVAFGPHQSDARRLFDGPAPRHRRQGRTGALVPPVPSARWRER